MVQRSVGGVRFVLLLGFAASGTVGTTMPQGSLWEKVPFGRTGLRVSRLAIGSSYGIGADDVERAFDRGLNFMFWGLRRTGRFGEGVRRIARSRRDDLVVAIQSYSRSALLMRTSVDRALRALRLDHVDLLGLGWWNEPPPRRIVDAALAIQASGKVNHLLISSHHRPTFAELIADPIYGSIMVRYSAAHVGAETEVFPHLGDRPPGVMAFTATRWRTLLDPSLTPARERTPTATDCYRFVLTHPSIDVSLTGPKNGEQLDGAMAALDAGPMSPEEIAWMKRVGVVVRRDARSGSPVDVLDSIGNVLRGRHNASDA